MTDSAPLLALERFHAIPLRLEAFHTIVGDHSCLQNACEQRKWQQVRKRARKEAENKVSCSPANAFCTDMERLLSGEDIAFASNDVNLKCGWARELWFIFLC